MLYKIVSSQVSGRGSVKKVESVNLKCLAKQIPMSLIAEQHFDEEKGVEFQRIWDDITWRLQSCRCTVQAGQRQGTGQSDFWAGGTLILKRLINYYDTFFGISSLNNMYFVLIQIHEGGPPHARTFTWICKWLEVINITSLLNMHSSPQCFKFPRIRHCGVLFKVIYRDSSLLKDVVGARKRQKMHQRRYNSLRHHFIYYILS